MTRATTKKLAAAVLLTTAGSAAAVLYANRAAAPPVVTTDAVSRGSIVQSISATATVEPVTTVEVGTQVSGTIQALYADFNSIVKKGQVLARLDPSLYQSAIEQAQANLTRAEADVERLQVALADAQVKATRARELAARQLIPASDLDTADVNARSAEAQVRSAAAQVTQAKAALGQAQVNLAKTIITAPINGIVVGRNVDVGQTVAASLSAPTLFVLAGSLDDMQLKANVDESDLGAIREGQPVTFTVDAYPRDTFSGVVEQVRLNPVVEQNVVTYAAIISAPNPELKLKPGMTANATIEVARHDDVLRVPSGALRLKPGEDVKKALGADGVAVKGTAVWQYADGVLRPLTVKAGASNGMLTEITGDGIREGLQVVTRIASGDAAKAAAPSSNSSSPLMTGPRMR